MQMQANLSGDTTVAGHSVAGKNTVAGHSVAGTLHLRARTQIDHDPLNTGVISYDFP